VSGEGQGLVVIGCHLLSGEVRGVVVVVVSDRFDSLMDDWMHN
jgi:hypothetical protein